VLQDVRSSCLSCLRVRALFASSDCFAATDAHGDLVGANWDVLPDMKSCGLSSLRVRSFDRQVALLVLMCTPSYEGRRQVMIVAERKFFLSQALARALLCLSIYLAGANAHCLLFVSSSVMSILSLGPHIVPSASASPG